MVSTINGQLAAAFIPVRAKRWTVAGKPPRYWKLTCQSQQCMLSLWGDPRPGVQDSKHHHIAHVQNKMPLRLVSFHSHLKLHSTDNTVGMTYVCIL